MSVTAGAVRPAPRRSLWTNPRVRGWVTQIVLCAVVVYLAWAAIQNAADNLAKARIATGFGFWEQTAGFDISQTLIDYTASSTYGRAFWVGLLNTLLVAGIGIVFATIIGFTVGIARLSRNWLLSKVAAGYVETIRNIPLLLQLLFWYNAVLKALPDIRDSYVLPGGAFLNNRGLELPKPIFAGDGKTFALVFGAGVIAALIYRWLAKAKQARTGQQSPVFLVGFALIAVPSAIFLVATGITFDVPVKGRFNITGGVEVLPEFAALLFGLSIYTAAFIAEVVRAGIQSVAVGQTEAAYALGLRPGPTMRLVIMPQAMRVIVPPLTSQYLNLTKNSSLAVAIGYPDLVQIFAGTVLNQTGQAVEVIAITMAVYLALSLATSLAMNVYNWRLQRMGAA